MYVLSRFRPLTRNLFPCLLQFLHSPQFVLCVLKSEMGIRVHRNPDFAMTHKVLQCLWVHSRFSHIAAIGVAADMRSNVWQLKAVNVVVPLNHIIEPVFPVHCNQWHSIFVVVQKSRVPIYYMKSGLRCPFLR